MFFSGRRGRHRADTPRKNIYMVSMQYGGGTAVAARRRRKPHRKRGATLPRSVTVGDRLAQKSDRHRPLSLRPVSLRRRIYMQFLLIVLLCVVVVGSTIAASTTTRYHRRRHLCNSAYRNNRTRAVVTKTLENITKTHPGVFLSYFPYFFILTL
uniref:Uncharacterized protein n=1 Tax=Sipha flava TaxID=143950 RepID=A0A2S2QMC6_9HEMI